MLRFRPSARRARFWSLACVCALLFMAPTGCDDGTAPEPPTGAVAGWVTADQTPVSGAILTLKRSDGPDITATTSLQGRFRFSGVGVGTVTVVVTPPEGYALAPAESGVRTATVPEDDTVEVSFRLARTEP